MTGRGEDVSEEPPFEGECGSGLDPAPQNRISYKASYKLASSVEGSSQTSTPLTVPSIAASNNPHSFTTRRLVTALACPGAVARVERRFNDFEGDGVFRREVGTAKVSQAPPLERPARTHG